MIVMVLMKVHPSLENMAVYHNQIDDYEQLKVHRRDSPNVDHRKEKMVLMKLALILVGKSDASFQKLAVLVVDLENIYENVLGLEDLMPNDQCEICIQYHHLLHNLEVEHSLEYMTNDFD